MMPVNTELDNLSVEMESLSWKKQKLLERKNILSTYQGLRNHSEFGQTEGAASSQQEIDQIDEILAEISAKQAKLGKGFDLRTKDSKGGKEGSVASKETTDCGHPGSGFTISCVGMPPSFPAPSVIMDVDKLPPWPSRTQCPECHQFVVTETSSSTSSVTWLVCMSIVTMCCVAGCCLVPFCLDKFKTITHKCPRCRTPIRVIKKL